MSRRESHRASVLAKSKMAAIQICGILHEESRARDILLFVIAMVNLPTSDGILFKYLNLFTIIEQKRQFCKKMLENKDVSWIL